MARNHVQTSQDNPQTISWQVSLRNALWWALTAAFALVAWYTLRMRWAGALAHWSIVFIFFILLAYSAEHGLESVPVKRVWRYRLAFLVPALYGFIGWLLLNPQHIRLSTAPFSFLSPFLVILASTFIGSLAATVVNEKLWENNSPPPEWITQEVEAFHRQAIGSPVRTPVLKRGIDILLAALGLLFSIPLWLVMIFLIWIEDPGPLLFVKNSVGKGGKNFHQYKFRTMVCQAEENTGPVLSSKGDDRILLTGHLLRKTALDELPQLINILVGDMSFTGPRPQRTVLVHGYLADIPGYAERHRVLPGLSGLAQVAGDYYLTPRQKLRFDRLYITHASPGFDIKLLFLAFLITFWYRWQPGWNGRLPRKWLHPG